MSRTFLKGLVVALIAVAAVPAMVGAQARSVNGYYAAIRDQWLADGGGNPLTAPVGDTVMGMDLPNEIGTLWENGPANLVNGLASERNTFTTGTGGPEGDHIATIAVDFDVPGLAAGAGSFTLEEFRICLFHTGTTSEMYGYVDDGGSPAAPVTAPLFGAPSTPDIVSTTFEDNGARCGGAFGYPGRQYQFNAATTGTVMPVVPVGTYWVAAVGEGGSRGFWAQSNGPTDPGNTGNSDVWGSSVFGAAYWTPTSSQGQANFAMDIDGFVAGEPVISVDPNRQLGGQVHLPILNFQGQDDVCRTWIEVQYLGCDPSKAVLVTWGEPGFCPPQAAGPLKVECTGLLQGGSTWNLLGAQIPTGSKSGILFKFTAKQLSDVGLDDDLGFDDVVADLMCETLFFGVVGDSDDYRRFKKAYNEGLDFAGINQRIAAGAGVLAVEVLRHCPGDVTPGVEVSSKYNGIAGTHLGAYDPVFGGFGYYVPLIYAEKAGLNTVMYIQNGGLECSSVEIWFKAQDDCLRARICEIFTLAPGESYQWDASDCVGPDWQGSAWLRSSQEMGIAVDIFGRDVLMTYTGEPQPYAYVLANADGEPEVVASVTTGETVAYGPLMYSEYQGWDTGVQVQNLSEVYNAKVKVYFLDRSGDVITTLVDWICPRGSQTFFLPVVADLPGTWVGSIRIESQDWWTPGTNPIDAPNIVGVATLMKYSDAARTDTQEAIAYNLLPEHKAYIWQIGSGPGGTVSGVGLVAIPSLLKDLDGTGTTSEVAIMNLSQKPGFTDFAIYIYDQNGLLDFVCEKLHSRQVEYIDLQTWGYVNNGFKGSAIISATFWEHDVFTPTGLFVRNILGLGAVSIERTGTRLGEDVPGDEAAGSRGIPFETDRNIGLCLGGFRPVCPGQPLWDPQP
ncbi:MAG: hypothetical protein H6648_03940 [Caldilineae bacterium]|nr:hypothetical protein [Caldilineae bacterium]